MHKTQVCQNALTKKINNFCWKVTFFPTLALQNRPIYKKRKDFLYLFLELYAISVLQTDCTLTLFTGFEM